MEVAPFFVDFHHLLLIFTIFYRFSRFTHFCRDLHFVAIYALFPQIYFGQNSLLRNITRFLHVCLRALHQLDVVCIQNQTVLFILRKDALYQVVCIYFKSAMCFVTLPFLDAATLFCLEATKELFIISIIFRIIFDNCFKIWTIGRGLVLFWSITLIAFSQFLSLRYQMSSQMHCLQQFKAKVV